MSMKHKTNQALFDYWNAIRAGRPAPRRSEIEPGNIRRILPYVFILERKDRGDYRFRLAGTGLCSVYGMEFRGHNMLSMWQDDCVENLKQALEDVTREATISVVEYTATTNDRREATFEMILLPLAHEDGSVSRVLGAAVPIDQFPWIGDRLLARQWIDRLRRLDPERMPKRMPVAEQVARRLVIEKPPFTTPNIATRANRQPPLRGERSYLRLVKGVAGGNEERG
ncbi:MAG: PAS domain-containing protein [Alphaproteobacteria bacterium HGW-Alphaproteobacteria-12]|nr:MAG: PAS domain-containing protein [Alphaproteobacteria bacterium HGW-Alphaproteobacteria-12]